MGRHDATDDFVAVQRPQLFRLALLVTDDAALAERISTRVLARLLEGWPQAAASGRPGALARTRLLHDALAAAVERSDRERRRAGESRPARAAGGPRPTADPVREALLSCWSGLHAEQRAAVLLTDLDDLPEEVAAQELGMPRAAFDRVLGGARANLAGAFAAARRETEPPTQTLRDAEPGAGTPRGAASFLPELACALELRVAARQPLGSPAVDVAAAMRQLRQLRQRRRIAASGLVIVLALGGFATWAGLRTPEPPAPSTTQAPPHRPEGSWDRVSTWPGRGSLVGDPHVVAGVTTRYGAAYRILWADELDGHRYVLLVSPAPRRLGAPRVLLLAGAAHATVDALAERQTWGVRDDDRLIVLLGPQGTGPRPLVILATPDEPVAEVSLFVRIDARNRVSRTWIPLPLSDGIGTRQVSSGPYPALLVRTGHETRPVATTPPGWAGAPAAACRDCAAPADLRPLIGGVRVEAAAATGLPVSAVRPELVLLSPVATGAADRWAVKPRPETEPTADPPARGDRAVVFLVRLPSGAVLRSTWVTPAGSAWTEVPPARPVETNVPVDPDRPEQEPVLVPVHGGDGELRGFELLLTARSPIRAVQFAGGSSAGLPRVPVGTGATWLRASGRLPSGAVLRTWDGAGRPLAAYPVPAASRFGPWAAASPAPVPPASSGSSAAGRAAQSPWPATAAASAAAASGSR